MYVRGSARRSGASWYSDAVAVATIVGGTAAGMYFKDEIRQTSLYRISVDFGLMPLLRLVDPEQAHNLAIKAAALRLSPKDPVIDDEPLQVQVWGVDFPNCVGLAAGFDKHAEALGGLSELGFGLIEVGSVTPLPQPGNPKPRMFRLSEDKAVINRYGFNSEGHEAVKHRLEMERLLGHDKLRKAMLGVNVGKNKTQKDAAADYCAGIRELGPFADYVVVNVSSPNTPGLRDLQKKAAILELMTATIAARDAIKQEDKPLPLLVKVAPDLDEKEKRDIAEAAMSAGVDGLIVSNTTVARPETLQSAHKDEKGGLSGAPLREMATQTVSDFYRITEGKLPLVGVGGVGTGADAFEKIIAGASIVQVYSLLSFSGPGTIVRLKEQLKGILRENGFASVEEAIGARHRGFEWSHPGNE